MGAVCKQAAGVCQDDEQKSQLVTSKQLKLLAFIFHPASVVLHKDLPSSCCLLFCSLIQTSPFFFVSLLFESHQEEPEGDWTGLSCWCTNELQMRGNQRPKLQAGSSNSENKGSVLDCDGNTSVPWDDPSPNVILTGRGDALNS